MTRVEDRRQQWFAWACKPAGKNDLWCALAIVLVAALLRAWVVLRFSGEPVWDGHYYHFGAVRLASGFGYSEDVIRQGVKIWKPWTHYPVGYSFWLSLWYRALGAKLWVAPLSNAVVGCVTVFCVHRLALPHLGLCRARIAALVTAFHPGLVLYTAVAMSEPLAASLLLASLWPLLALRQRVVATGLSGMLLGASVLVRPSSLVALPLYWLMLDGSTLQKLKHGALVTLFCFGAILPWTLRNCQRMDGCALVSTNAGWNLAIGALTETGRFRPLRASDGCPVVTGQVQQDRCWMQRGLAEIRRDPLRWLNLAPKKLAQTFDHESFVVEYLREANPSVWPEQRRSEWRERLTEAHRWLVAIAALSAVAVVTGRRCYRSVAFYVQTSALMGLLTLIALVMNHDEHPLHWLILALPGLAMVPLPGRPNLSGLVGFCIGFLGLTALTHVFFFGDDRYHIVVSPLLCILCAAALRRPKAKPPRPTARSGSAWDQRSVPRSF